LRLSDGAGRLARGRRGGCDEPGPKRCFRCSAACAWPRPRPAGRPRRPAPPPGPTR